MSNLLSAITAQTMSSLEIAKLTGKRHGDVLETIRSVLSEAEIDSTVFSAEYKDKSGKVNPLFNLPRRECDLVIAGYSVKYRLAIIDRWHELELKEFQKQDDKLSRENLRLEFPAMTNAIVESREGKEIKSHHFSNEADLCNRIALGCTSAKFRVLHEIDKNEPIRDYLSTEQKNCLLALQRANTVYLSDDLSFDERKEKLLSLYMRKFKERLINEVKLIES